VTALAAYYLAQMVNKLRLRKGTVERNGMVLMDKEKQLILHISEEKHKSALKSQEEYFYLFVQ
jgi:hypothetical protein